MQSVDLFGGSSTGVQVCCVITYLLYVVFAEVASAHVEEERQKALANDFAEDSRLDRMLWSFDSLRRWERTMKI